MVPKSVTFELPLRIIQIAGITSSHSILRLRGILVAGAIFGVRDPTTARLHHRPTVRRIIVDAGARAA